VRVVEVLERNGRGLNLCWEVIEGIKHHTPDDPWPSTLEGGVVRLADRIAYLRHDIEDAISAGVLKASQLPKKELKVLGSNILDTIVGDIVIQSRHQPKIKMSPAIQKAMDNLYDFMYQNVYTNPTAKREETKVPELIQRLFRYYHYNVKWQKGFKTEAAQLQHTIDFIAGMTDRYAINQFEELFVPDEWRNQP
jgi:dGTPase